MTTHPHVCPQSLPAKICQRSHTHTHANATPTEGDVSLESVGMSCLTLGALAAGMNAELARLSATNCVLHELGASSNDCSKPKGTSCCVCVHVVCVPTYTHIMRTHTTCTHTHDAHIDNVHTHTGKACNVCNGGKTLRTRKIRKIYYIYNIFKTRKSLFDL